MTNLNLVSRQQLIESLEEMMGKAAKLKTSLKEIEESALSSQDLTEKILSKCFHESEILSCTIQPLFNTSDGTWLVTLSWRVDSYEDGNDYPEYGEVRAGGFTIGSAIEKAIEKYKEITTMQDVTIQYKPTFEGSRDARRAKLFSQFGELEHSSLGGLQCDLDWQSLSTSGQTIVATLPVCMVGKLKSRLEHISYRVDEIVDRQVVQE
jgi:hypothetical protein